MESRFDHRAAVLLCCLVAPFTGNVAHVDLTVFCVVFAVALLTGAALTLRAQTRPIGVGMLIAVALAFFAFVLASFWWLGWLANELQDS